MAPRVLISDKLSPAAVAIFKERGVEVDVKPGLDKDELAKIIGDYDGLAIRSATKVTAKLLEHATKLKVVGRAGIGVDNVDIPAATARGVIVMNTPFGNSITTAEHAIAMMFALARQLPAADLSTQAGKWEKNRFMGVELTGKTLGVIGCGNIGSIAATRGLGLKMRVVAYDPFLSPERAAEIGVEKVELDDLLARADFITLHTPLTAQTKNILSAENLAKTKKGVRIINCARGGLVDEAALRAALDSGHVAGAAFDVFVEEPAKENPLFGHPNFIATPHLGASTSEAQENVALQVAEQMSDYLIRGAISNAVNFPSITAEEAPKLKPFIALAEGLGSFAGQLTHAPIEKVTIAYDGAVADLKIKALTSAAVASGRQRRLGGGGRREPRHRRRGGDARRPGRLRKLHHPDGDDEGADALDRRNRLPRRQATHPVDQGDQGRRGVHSVDDLCHQRGQAGLHRAVRERARRRRGQHRDLRPRARRAGRLRDRAGVGRRPGPARGSGAGRQAQGRAAGERAAFLRRLRKRPGRAKAGANDMELRQQTLACGAWRV
jgi:D-3-phosphoglycerate dehydrogenase / 2-oxoglutarate reductase